jgi:hypothetical protein
MKFTVSEPYSAEPEPPMKFTVSEPYSAEPEPEPPMKFRIPEQFTVMGYTIRVSLDPKLDAEADRNWGVASLEEGTIRLNPKLLERDAVFQAHVFLHEVLHILLDAFGSKLSEDEAFVDTLSGVAAQALFSARGSVALRADFKAEGPAVELARYRFLRPDEIVEDADEWFNVFTGKWVTTYNPGLKVGTSAFFRRKL